MENISEWAWSCISKSRYNQYTSSISESFNNSIGVFRTNSEVDLLINIYNYISDKFYKMYNDSMSISTTYTPYCTSILSMQSWFNNNKNVSFFLAVITNKNRNKNNTESEYLVDLYRRTCSCGHNSENCIPFNHATKLLS